MDFIFQRAFKLSLGVHGAAILGAVIFSLLTTCKTEPEPLVFELVGAAPAPQQSDSARPDPESIDAFKVEELPPLPDVPELPRKKPTPTPIQSPVPTPPPKPARKQISYEEFIKNRELPDRRQVVQRPSNQRVATTEITTDIRKRLESEPSDIRIEGISVASAQDMDALLRYQVLLSQAIERVFVPQGDGLIATVLFSVSSSGRIHSGRIVQSSGVGAFDQAALRALQVARAPGPPPGNQTLQFSLNFRSK
jgi:TonB family protein